MNQEKIGIFISKMRKEKGWTQNQLAQKLGVTNKAVSKWENARCLPETSVLPALAEALGCKGIRVTKKEEVAPALKEAFAYGGPVLLDCQIDCDDKVFPMVPAGAAIEESFDQDDLKEEKSKTPQQADGASNL